MRIIFYHIEIIENHISFQKELTSRHSIPIDIYNWFSLVLYLRPFANRSMCLDVSHFFSFARQQFLYDLRS